VLAALGIMLGQPGIIAGIVSATAIGKASWLKK
jgi:hypothetical protein